MSGQKANLLWAGYTCKSLYGCEGHSAATDDFEMALPASWYAQVTSLQKSTTFHTAEVRHHQVRAPLQPTLLCVGCLLCRLQ